MQVKRQQLKPDMEQWTGSKLGKEYIKAVYCHPAYLSSMQSKSCKMPDWMKHKLESRLLAEISITSDMQMTPPLWQKGNRNWRASWWQWKRKVKKLACNSTFEKLRSWHLVPSLHGKLIGKQWKQWQDFIFLDSKITADGDCSHEMKRLFLLGRKAVTNLDSILKSRDTTLPTKVCLVKAVVFPVVMYGCESWTIKKAEHRSTDAFEQWRRLLRVPWTVRRWNQPILNEISPEYSLEGLMLKLKLHYFGYLMWRTESLEKTLMLGKIEGRGRRRWQKMRCPTRWTWVWASSRSWWWTGKPGMLQSMGSQRVGHDWGPELNWTDGT